MCRHEGSAPGWSVLEDRIKWIGVLSAIIVNLLAAASALASDFAAEVMEATFKIYQWMTLQVFGRGGC